MEREVATAEDTTTYAWYHSRRILRVATILVSRDDLSLQEIQDAAADDAMRNVVAAIASKSLTVEHLLVHEEIDSSSREHLRYAKYLIQLSNGKSVAMTGAEWMATRSFSTDTLVARLAMNVVKLGENRRLLRALRAVTGTSVLGQGDLGYLCCHAGAHSTTNAESLYHALGQYDANEMITMAPEWTVGWLDALEPEARVIALAVLDSGSAGSTMQTVTDAAIAVANV
jgi:hypothetical protein